MPPKTNLRGNSVRFSIDTYPVYLQEFILACIIYGTFIAYIKKLYFIGLLLIFIAVMCSI